MFLSNLASSDASWASCLYSLPFSSTLVYGIDLFSSFYLCHLLSHSGNTDLLQIDLNCSRFYIKRGRVPSGFRDFDRIKMLINLDIGCLVKEFY